MLVTTGQHGFGGRCPPGLGPRVEADEPMGRLGAHHVGQHVGRQFAGHGLTGALRVRPRSRWPRRPRGPGRRCTCPPRQGLPKAAWLLAQVGEVGVVRSEGRPHHRMGDAVDLRPTTRIRSQFRGAPYANRSPGPELRTVVEDFQDDGVDVIVSEAVLRVGRPHLDRYRGTRPLSPR